MTTPRRRHVDIPDASRLSRRDFLTSTGAAGAAIVVPGLVPVSARAAPAQVPGEVRVLPAPSKEGGMPLMQALSLRRSTREFSTRKIPDQVLGDLLWAAYGVNRANGDRTAPSWRHIIVIDVYAAMEDGLWLYDPKRHALVAHPAGDIRARTGQQDFPARAPLNLVYVAHGQRMSELTPENRKLFCSVDTRLHRAERLPLLRLRGPRDGVPRRRGLPDARAGDAAAGGAVRHVRADGGVSEGERRPPLTPGPVSRKRRGGPFSLRGGCG